MPRKAELVSWGDITPKVNRCMRRGHEGAHRIRQDGGCADGQIIGIGEMGSWRIGQ